MAWAKRTARVLEADLREVRDGDGEAFGRRSQARGPFVERFPECAGELERLEAAWFERSRELLVEDWRRRESRGGPEARAWLDGLDHRVGAELFRVGFDAAKAEALGRVRRKDYAGARQGAERFLEVWGDTVAARARKAELAPFVEGYRFLAELAERRNRPGRPASRVPRGG